MMTVGAGGIGWRQRLRQKCLEEENGWREMRLRRTRV